MNRFAYRTTGLAIKALYNLSKAKVHIHGKENIPEGSIIFVINHFTRIETLIIPYYIFQLTKIPVWSLASFELFRGTLGTFLDKVGAVSTKDPHRDLLIVKSLITGEATWVIFPEGQMVKDQKFIKKGRFIISDENGIRPPHTGAATLALRTEFYRQRLLKMNHTDPDEAKRLMALFQIDAIETISEKSTFIVPVNISYYPVRAKENVLSNLAINLVDNIPERVVEELMTEGSMLLSGVDMDIRFGEAIKIKEYMKHTAICRDIASCHRINFDDPIASKAVLRKKGLAVMQRYMAAIYNMTTVNHDHLFASIFRQIPFSKIDEDDLQRRVFLAIVACQHQQGVNLHKSLESEQIHLLTDDRYGKFKDFISVALEKGFLEKRGRTLVRNKSKLVSMSEFHRVRIENPIGVLANAVEPLKTLQHHLRIISWMPPFWVRRKTTRYLLKKAAKEFKKDYADYYIEGESKSKEVGMPFLKRSRSRQVGVVLIHGYMAAPMEVKGLAVYLGRLGCWVYAPRLKGHGTSPEDLSRCTYLDWVKSVDEAYAVIKNSCRQVVVGGFSTGAGLALDLAARVNDVAGVFAICPPMRLQDISSKLVPAVDAWNRLMKTVRLNGAKKEFVNNSPENPYINYLRNPISGVRELERLMVQLEAKLPSIHTPALIAQSGGDPVVDPKGSKQLYEKLGAKEKAYILFNFDRHGILLGSGARRVYRAIGDFIQHLK